MLCTRQEEQDCPGLSGIPSRCHLPSLNMKDRERRKRSRSHHGDPALLQGHKESKALGPCKVRNVIQAVSPPLTALYETLPCFITPGTEVTLGLRSPFKFLTLFDFLLSVSRAKIDLMHHNPLVCAPEQHLPCSLLHLAGAT